MKTIMAATLLTASVAPTHAQLLKPAGLLPAKAARVLPSATNYVMDSICTMQMDGTPLQKQVPEYNADGLAIALYEYGYSQSASNAAPVAVPTGKHAYSYTNGGVMQKEEVYEYDGYDYLLMSQVEITEFTKDGELPLTTLYSQLKDGQLQPYMKVVTTQTARGHVVDYAVYVPQNGRWLPYGNGHLDYNADGTTQQETVTIPLGNYTITEVVAYEYDSHQTATRITVTASVMDQVVESEEVVYENSYDERDLLVEQKTMHSGEEPTISLMFWSDGLTTAVAAQRLQRLVRERSFDLSGRQRHDGQKPKGVYIIGGRKVVRR